MLSIRNYVKVNSLEEAYTLNQKKNNKIVAGMLWLKLTNLNLDTAIDLSNLGLDKICETADSFEIGAMTTLRDLETNESLLNFTDGMIKEALKSIVGVQFRNLATIGGSLYSRFGFSDVLTFFLSLDTEVELYNKGRISLKEFVSLPYDNDILVKIIVKKNLVKQAYYSERISKTDFPVLTLSLAKLDSEYRLAIGARPGAARLITFKEYDAKILEEALNLSYFDNMRGSSEYRKHLVSVYLKRALERVGA